MKICERLNIRQLILDAHYPEMDGRVSRKKIDFLDLQAVESAIFEFCGLNKVDCVVAIGSLEHLTKIDGELLLRMVEGWSSKLIIIETPNGFVEQGVADGNIKQIHLSGWRQNDFKLLGYRIIGTTGLKVLKKASHKGQYKFNIKGIRFFDVVFSKILLIRYFPNANFNLFAYKILK